MFRHAFVLNYYDIATQVTKEKVQFYNCQCFQQSYFVLNKNPNDYSVPHFSTLLVMLSYMHLICV